MINKKFKIFIILILAIIALGLISITKNTGNKDTYTTEELEASEVREYEGKDLSSINDFRENSIKGPQYIDKESYKLKIKGLDGGEIALKYGEVLNRQKYKKVVTLNCVEGWNVTVLWEGILFRELIDKDKIPESANTIIFRAHDGYSTSFPVEYIMDNDILMAYKMNGLELSPERGFPFQVVAEDKYGYKWIKWIAEIEFGDDADYEGYWESRGYSNEGNLGEKFIK